MVSDTPTLKEEIDRKTIDTLVAALELHEAGRITDERMAVIARAVWDVSAGLTTKEVMEKVSKVIEEHPLRPCKRTFFGIEGLVQLRWFPERAGLGLVTHHPVTLEKTSRLIGDREIAGQERDEKIKQVAQALKGKGFIEIH